MLEPPSPSPKRTARRTALPADAVVIPDDPVRLTDPSPAIRRRTATTAPGTRRALVILSSDDDGDGDGGGEDDEDGPDRGGSRNGADSSSASSSGSARPGAAAVDLDASVAALARVLPEFRRDRLADALLAHDFNLDAAAAALLEEPLPEPPAAAAEVASGRRRARLRTGSAAAPSADAEPVTAPGRKRVRGAGAAASAASEAAQAVPPSSGLPAVDAVDPTGACHPLPAPSTLPRPFRLTGRHNRASWSRNPSRPSTRPAHSSLLIRSHAPIPRTH